MTKAKTKFIKGIQDSKDKTTSSLERLNFEHLEGWEIISII